MRAKRYKVYDGDELLGTFKAKEISEMLGVPHSYPSAYEAQGNTLHGRYRFVSVEEDKSNELDEIKRKWDETRIKILTS